MFKDRGVSFLGVNVWDKEEQARKFVTARGVPYAVGHDKGDRIAKLYGVQGTPTTFLLSENGIVAAVAQGRIEMESLAVILESLLNRP
jgi:cytochrome c biogenesis protein CcmG, thiol:disulfide interchange protein DsbE